RPIHAESFAVVAVNAKRAVQRERVRGGALVTIGHHDRHTSERAQLLLELHQSRRVHAVVVGEENVHALPRGARRMAGPGTARSSVRRPRAPTIRGTSRNGRMWLPASPYTVGISTSATRYPRRAARTAIAVSSS